MEAKAAVKFLFIVFELDQKKASEDISEMSSNLIKLVQ